MWTDRRWDVDGVRDGHILELGVAVLGCACTHMARNAHAHEGTHISETHIDTHARTHVHTHTHAHAYNMSLHMAIHKSINALVESLHRIIRVSLHTCLYTRFSPHASLHIRLHTSLYTPMAHGLDNAFLYTSLHACRCVAGERRRAMQHGEGVAERPVGQRPLACRRSRDEIRWCRNMYGI